MRPAGRRRCRGMCAAWPGPLQRPRCTRAHKKAGASYLAPAVIAKLNAESNRALQSTSVIAELRQQGLEPVGGSSAEATAWIGTEVARWTGIIRDAGIRG